MNRAILVLGGSGTGKSSSIGTIPELGIQGLPPEETALINVKNKPLPFRGSMKKYSKPISQGGNYACINSAEIIVKVIASLVARQDIKYIVLDDAQYIMSDEFMAKANRTGFDKYNEIAKHFFDILQVSCSMLRDDQTFFMLSHSEVNEAERIYKMKTIGQMIDQKIVPEGLFTVVLHTYGEYNAQEKTMHRYFVTNTMYDENGIRIPAKSPVGMFNEVLIPNDLGIVAKAFDNYFNEV